MANFNEGENLSFINRVKLSISRLTGLKIKKIDQIGLFFFIALALSTTLTWLFEERFNKAQWKTQPRTRYKMAEDIIENKLIIGKTKQEIVLLLGEDIMYSNANKKEQFVYSLGTPPSFFETKKEKLIIIFENDTVVKVIKSPK